MPIMDAAVRRKVPKHAFPAANSTVGLDKRTIVADEADVRHIAMLWLRFRLPMRRVEQQLRGQGAERLTK